MMTLAMGKLIAWQARYTMGLSTTYYEEIMSHLRMPTDLVAARSGVKIRKGDYFFTQLFWHAIQHIGGQDLMIEGNFVEPNDRLPMWVMRGIDYAIAKGAEAFVAEYHRVDDPTPVGMILQLKWGHTLIGAYAVKYQS